MSSADPLQETPSAPPVSRRRRWLLRIAAVVFGLMVAFVVAEVAVRILRIDVYPPMEWVREKVEQYESSPTTRMIYDEQTGWSPRPGVVTHEGRYQYESHGIRSRSSQQDYSVTPKPGVTRIAIFGDSFAHCDDVPFQHSWGRILETNLNRQRNSDANFQVVNFGVSAYGMDQAFQRWRSLGKRFSPQIVLFGFQGENVARNVNLLRGFYVKYTGIPFSKPRFILDDGRLKAINVPAIPPRRVPSVMANMGDWPFAKHEWFYAPRKVETRWWQRSRFLAVLAERFREQTAVEWDGESVYEPDGEPERVTLRILREFKREVEAQGGRFTIVHLPKKSDLQRLRKGRGLYFDRLWRLLTKEHTVIDPRESLLAAARKGSLNDLFAKPKYAHYSETGNRIIADAITGTLQK